MKLKIDLERRHAIYGIIEAGDISLPRAVRELRRSVGKTQAEYATLVGLSLRVLKDIEQGKGNPTLESLRKVLRPFDLDIGVRRKSRQLE